VPIRLTLRYEEEEIAVGTAFFYSNDNKDYLITNWHNVTGRKPWDRKPISKDCAIPDNLVVRFPYRDILDSGKDDEFSYSDEPKIKKSFEGFKF